MRSPGWSAGWGWRRAATSARRWLIFEAVHGSAPDIAWRGIANPSALILAAAMLCDHIGETTAGDRIRRAIIATIVADGVRTRDLGGTASTKEFGDAVARRVA